MIPIKEHDPAVLTIDLPDLGLRAGDVGTVVDVHGSGAGYEVEFCTLTGETIGVITVTAPQVRPVERLDMLHARSRSA